MQKGTLEDHLKLLHSLESEVAEYRPNVDELEQYNQEVQEALVFDNPHTPYTMEASLRPCYYHKSGIASSDLDSSNLISSELSLVGLCGNDQSWRSTQFR